VPRVADPDGVRRLVERLRPLEVTELAVRFQESMKRARVTVVFRQASQ
jgi:hypothetical protein